MAVPLRLLHLVGSPTSDFYARLSTLYARDCLAVTTRSERYASVVAYVAPDRSWRFPVDLTPASIAAAPAVPAGQALAHLATLRIDVVLPQLFCLAGMTTYRGLLEVLGLPYVGNTARTMAFGADKAVARALVAAAGVAVPAGEVLRPGQTPSVRPPAVVKPVDADNSLGVTLVTDPSGYAAALRAAHAHADRALVEDFVPLGREVRCGIVVRGDELVCLPLEEYAMDPRDKPVRLPADKLRDGTGGDLELVAKESTRAWVVDPDDPVTGPVWDAARACHTALGCQHYSLFDFRVDPDGRPWFLEASLYCSYAEQSVLSAMARAAGLSLTDLLHLGVDAALAPAPRTEDPPC